MSTGEQIERELKVQTRVYSSAETLRSQLLLTQQMIQHTNILSINKTDAIVFRLLFSD